MAFVDDDDAEGVLAVVLGKEAGEVLVVVIQPQRLVGGDVDAGVAGGVAAVLGFDDAGIVAEGGFELGVGLLAQFIAVAEKQRGFGQLPGLRAGARADWWR